jgi:hypothetical protein
VRCGKCAKNPPAWRVVTWSYARPLHLSRMRKQSGPLYPSSFNSCPSPLDRSKKG